MESRSSFCRRGKKQGSVKGRKTLEKHNANSHTPESSKEGRIEASSQMGKAEDKDCVKG